MKLTVLNSGSKGNCYAIQNDTEALIIECGCNIADCLKALSFNTKKVAGVLLSHEHQDHAKYIEQYMSYFKAFCSSGTAKAIKYKGNNRPCELQALKVVKIGNFTVLPFATQHDSSEPFGYLIKHKDIGTLLFATDTYYLKYKFKGLTNVMIECNYDIYILNKNVASGLIHPKVYKRTLQSHLSLDNCITTLKANDLTNVSTIVLIHLSNANADRINFVQQVEIATGKRTVVAAKGLETELNKTPF